MVRQWISANCGIKMKNVQQIHLKKLSGIIILQRFSGNIYIYICVYACIYICIYIYAKDNILIWLKKVWFCDFCHYLAPVVLYGMASGRIHVSVDVLVCCLLEHDDVIKWKHFPRNWPFVRGIHRSRWIPHTKASDAELWCFLWYVSE